MNGFANGLMILFNWNVKDLEGLSNIKKKSKMQGTLEIGVLTDDLIVILQGKDLQAVINFNEVWTDETYLDAEGTGNVGKSVLCNL